ncbi:hypothetical protein [Halomarina rubra]|uniref:Amphi-Trp domain-containing protein n=1 Tax=Halomarina rubra TaxID=2071873 RepID=A0ABD6AZ92_9EURY|nr:hypothetical protein [Halomarina rubra]
MSGLNAERTVTRTEAAEYLREFADKLANGGHGGTDRTTGSTTGKPTTGDATGETTHHGSADGSTTEGTTGTPTGESQTTQETQGTQNAQTGQYGKVTFLVGNDSATVNPPEEVTLNVDVGEDSSMMSSGAETVTFSLHWDKQAVPESDELRIE